MTTRSTPCSPLAGSNSHTSSLCADTGQPLHSCLLFCTYQGNCQAVHHSSARFMRAEGLRRSTEASVNIP